MASPARSFIKNGRNNGSQGPTEQVFAVPPLNSVPYMGSPTPFGDGVFSTTGNTMSADVVRASMIFFPSRPDKEEWKNIVGSVSNGVGLTGAAARGMIGPMIGKMDISESEDAYLFRVALPGVGDNDFSCNIELDGKVVLRGVTTTGEPIVYKNSQVFTMQSQNMCGPGNFSVTFELPGPVDPQQFKGNLSNGIIEGIVKKSE